MADSSRSLVIREMVLEADGVLSLELVDPSGGSLPSWEAGAHIDLEIAPQLLRQYSLCGQPHDVHRWRIAVLEEPNSSGGSWAVHHVLHAGDNVRALGPRNNFPLTVAKNYLFIAGGIGITPILPMVREVTSRDVEWHLLYGGRRRASMAFLDELATTEQVEVVPEDEFGLLDIKGAIAGTPADTAVYCCGPEPLIAAVEAACAAAERQPPHTERFKLAAARTPELPADGQDEFEVVLARSGLTLRVPPDKSVLEVVEDAGVMAFSSCREGYCGCCETDILEGEVDHRDDYLFEKDRASGKKMMICVSRSRSPRLVLDL